MDFLRRIFQAIVNLFAGNSGDAKQRREMRRLENDLRLETPGIYKNGQLTPEFAEAVFTLYTHTRPIEALLDATVCNEDIKIAHKYQGSLFFTGFSEEMRALYASLSFEARKKEAGTVQNESLAYEKQRKKFDALLKYVSGEEFEKIDLVITNLQRLKDLCNVNYVSALSVFDKDFQAADPLYRPAFQEAPLGSIEGFIVDFYYVAADFHITEGLARAIFALDDLLRHREKEDPKARETTLHHLKKIQAALAKRLTPASLVKLVRLNRGDLSVTLEQAAYLPGALTVFAAGLRETFESDLQRIKMELQNEMVAEELKRLFGDIPLENVHGYNDETGSYLSQNTPLSFLWTMPFRVFKTFLVTYFDERLQTVLKDIAIEGFFNNQTYKSEFSSLVYNSCDALREVQQFESKFTPIGGNYEALIHSHVADSRRDEAFLGKLTKLVSQINAEAKGILSSHTMQFGELYKHALEILEDAKKPTPDYVANAKLLLSSIRNRDKAELILTQLPRWEIFFEVMLDYGVIAGPVRQEKR